MLYLGSIVLLLIGWVLFFVVSPIVALPFFFASLVCSYLSMYSALVRR